MSPDNTIPQNSLASLMSEVYNRQRDCILQMLRKLTRGDNELAEDILHDSVIKLLLWGGPVKGFEHLSVLLTKAAKQIWINHYSRTIPKNKKIITACKSAENISEPISTIDYYPYSKEIVKRIQSLSKQQKIVINAVFFEGMTCTEITSTHKIKDGNISLQKRRALEKLKNNYQ